MGAILAGIVILALAIVFGWAFFEFAIGLAIGVAALIAIIFIAVVVAAAIGVLRALV